MISSFILSNSVGRMCVVNGNGNSDKYETYLEDFLFPSLEARFRDNDVIFMNGNSS